MKTEIKPTKEVACKIIGLLEHGLTAGLGRAEPGKACVEAVVCMAFGLPHSDNPPCVGKAVRGFKIALNDCSWSSNEARAAGMKKLAIAQLGSDTIDQQAFADGLLLKGVNRILPLLFRMLAEDKECKNAADMLKGAELCEKAKTPIESREAAKIAYAYASAYASAYAYAYAYGSAHAYAYASASASASASAYWKKILGVDCILNLSAQIALEVLIELKSPGCEWLDLCD